jgi:hypothetical protein
MAKTIAAFVVVVGVFWAGRESSHGLSAFSDHWWCPIPLGLMLVGAVTFLLIRRSPEAA